MLRILFGDCRVSYFEVQDNGAKVHQSPCWFSCRHVLPEELGLQHAEAADIQYDDMLQSGHAVILYMHGNAGSRSVSYALCVISCNVYSFQ